MSCFAACSLQTLRFHQQAGIHTLEIKNRLVCALAFFFHIHQEYWIYTPPPIPYRWKVALQAYPVTCRGAQVCILLLVVPSFLFSYTVTVFQRTLKTSASVNTGGKAFPPWAASCLTGMFTQRLCSPLGNSRSAEAHLVLATTAAAEGWHLHSCREWLPRGGSLHWILHEPVNIVFNITILVLLRDLNHQDITS